MKRTITDIRDIETGEEHSASYYLDVVEDTVFKLRRKAYEQGHLVCTVCNQPLKISGTKDQQLYFRHKQDSEVCPIKTSGDLSQKEINRLKYRGAKESAKHKEIKHHISTMLRLDPLFAEVIEERVIKSSNPDSVAWKRPDVSAFIQNRRIVFEIQLATTYLDVIVERERFYREDETIIMWFFKQDDISKFRFTEKDILYSNKNNAFIINDETMMRSISEGKLYFYCKYQQAFIDDGKIHNHWQKKLICMDDVQFDSIEYRVFYYDLETESIKLKNELQAIQDIENKNKQKFILDEFEVYWFTRDSLEEQEYLERDRYFQEKLASIGLKLEDFRKISPILNALYSLKRQKIIGSKLPNFVALTNNIFTHYPFHVRIYLWGLKIYGSSKQVEDIKNRDSFKNKLKIYKNDRPQQDCEAEKLLRALFPELDQNFRK